jgi:Mycothiol maleylpyruvate isomerase N-terminal domain
MTTASTRYAHPVEEARRGHDAALAALSGAVARSAELWRRAPDPQAPVPGLTWTAAETAAHIIGDLREYTDDLSHDHRTPVGDLGLGAGSPSKRSALVNAAHLTAVRERDMQRLADMLEEQAERYLAAAASADDSEAIVTANGLVLSPPIMTGLLLGEQLVHGLDIARASRTRWCIGHADSLLVIPAVLAVTPEYVHPKRSAGVNISFELRIRGGGRYRLAVREGTGEISAAGEKADCVISVDPVAFLLVGFGRIAQWRPIIGGQMMASGRKPWLALKFGTLLSSP